MDHRPCPLVASNATLLETGRYSDLTVRCGGKNYLLHRAIVCPRFEFLTIACDGRFKEGVTGVIDLPDDDPLAFARLIEYLYTLDYNDRSAEKGNDALTKASANALVYAMADKYNIAELAVLAETKFGPSIPELCDEDLLGVFDIVIGTTPPSRKALRSLMVAECVTRMPALVKNEAFVRFLDEHAEVGSALAIEGYETMRAEIDMVKGQLGEARDLMINQQRELKTLERTIADVKAHLIKGIIEGSTELA